MVEKMHFVNIAGPIGLMDTFVIQNIVAHEIELIDAGSVLSSVKGIRRFQEPNPYKKLVEKVRMLGQVADIDFYYEEDAPVTMTPTALIEPEIDGYERQIETIVHISDSLKSELSGKVQLRNQIEPMKNLQVEVQSFFDFDYMKFRFGFMPIDSFEKIFVYIEEMDCILYEISRNEEFVYVIYFMPRSKKQDIDNLFASMFFKRIWISSDIKGYPKDALEQLNNEIDEMTKRIEELDQQSKAYIEANIKRLDELYTYVVQLDRIFEVRDIAMRSDGAFYLMGWLPDSQLAAFEMDVDKQPGITCVIEDDETVSDRTPPTKLKNPKFFEPFEALVKMYGVPSYNEVDPTIFIGITYMVFFGIMFGDVGQGLIISTFGAFLYKKSGNLLGKMAIYLGASAAFSGLIYGSLFGNEEVLGELFHYTPVKPMSVMMEMLVATVVMGVLLIIAVMAINIKNIYITEDIGRLLTDRNGIAGLVFYLAALLGVVTAYFELGISPILILILLIAPMIVILLGHPLSNMINHKSEIFPKDKVGFIIEAVFELIETLLSFLSNTISFLRIGAFALNHVGFFLAFDMLSEIVAESAGAAGSIVVMIFGNLLIIVLEGLIVGIQGMRLTYYELFSRFFIGDGSEFKPFVIKNLEMN